MLLKLLTLGGLGYAGYKYYEKTKTPAAFAGNQGNVSVRDAGPDSMRDAPRRQWSKEDEASDASFPASDPPSTY